MSVSPYNACKSPPAEVVARLRPFVRVVGLFLTVVLRFHIESCGETLANTLVDNEEALTALQVRSPLMTDDDDALNKEGLIRPSSLEAISLWR